MPANKKLQQNKIIVILGPTSAGKSAVAIKLAQKFSGEIISVDSRQIYRGMDIGTGKVHGTWNIKHKTFISEGIAHFGIDIASPKTDYNVTKFKKYADKIIADILKRGKLPILCGGTGFWIKALVDNVVYPEVKPDFKLREKLSKQSVDELFMELKKLDPERAKNIDTKNPVRLIRALEICASLGHVPKQNQKSAVKNQEFLQIGVNIPKEKLHARIKKRLDQRWQTGMIEETRKLRQQGLSWKKIQSFGLGYFWIPEYLQEKISLEELYEKVYLAEKDYAKRQMTWFCKDSRIHWIKNYKDIQKEVTDFIKQ